MDIDLKKVLLYSEDSLRSRVQMRSIIQDLYPGKVREMNTLLDVYESGIPREIKNTGNIDDFQYTKYIQRIINDYGIQQAYAIEALNSWIDVCIIPGIASKLKLVGEQQKQPVEQPITLPIKHNTPTNSGQPKTVTGNISDYELEDLGNSVIISKYNGFDVDNTIIPNEMNGKSVIGIGKDAYKGCAGIKTLIISEGIVQIGEGAFSNCSNLNEVTLPTSLTRVGKNAFSSTGIIKIDFPNDIRIIEDRAFSGCEKLTNIQLLDNVEKIGAFSFYRCTSLSKIVFPAKVKEIGSSAFSSCTLLANVKLNEGLQTIGGAVFEGCKVLKSITIPKTVINFGKDIFKDGLYSFGKLDITVRCYPGTKAVEYARLNNLKVAKAN